MATKGRAISHEEIAQKFVDSGFYDFNAIGRLISEIGPQLAIHDDGWHGVNFGKFHILACVLRADDLVRVGGLNPTVAGMQAIESLTGRRLNES
jgi:hypothetical protein